MANTTATPLTPALARKEREKHAARPRLLARRGVSLMEILISIGVILVGLLGVAALLPVGRMEIVQSARMDRAAACGRAVLHEVQVRGIVDPARQGPDYWLAWYDSNNPYPNWNPGFSSASWSFVTTNESQLQYYQAYAIDPLYIASYINSPPSPSNVPNDVARFPYTSGAPVYMARCGYVTDDWNRNRLVNGSITANSYLAQVPLFDRVFQWADDLVFEPPQADPQARPIWAGGPEGQYSWLITVSPAANETTMLASSKNSYEVSVVVFCQRDFSPPSASLDPEKPGERVANVSLLGGGWGGGDAKLTVDSSGANAKQKSYLDVKTNDWLMLGGTVGTRRVFKWYRVVSAGDVTEDQTVTPHQWVRFVTLAGPDASGVTWSEAVLFTGVIGVYTQPIAK